MDGSSYPVERCDRTLDLLHEPIPTVADIIRQYREIRRDRPGWNYQLHLCRKIEDGFRLRHIATITDAEWIEFVDEVQRDNTAPTRERFIDGVLQFLRWCGTQGYRSGATPKFRRQPRDQAKLNIDVSKLLQMIRDDIDSKAICAEFGITQSKLTVICKQSGIFRGKAQRGVHKARLSDCLRSQCMAGDELMDQAMKTHPKYTSLRIRESDYVRALDHRSMQISHSGSTAAMCAALGSKLDRASRA